MAHHWVIPLWIPVRSFHSLQPIILHWDGTPQSYTFMDSGQIFPSYYPTFRRQNTELYPFGFPPDLSILYSLLTNIEMAHHRVIPLWIPVRSFHPLQHINLHWDGTQSSYTLMYSDQICQFFTTYYPTLRWLTTELYPYDYRPDLSILYRLLSYTGMAHHWVLYIWIPARYFHAL